jgi:hypothetical protein
LTLRRSLLPNAADLDALVDAALARRLHTVELDTSGVRGTAPALARLLGSDALTTLKCSNTVFMTAPSAATVAAALRANSTLTSLTLCASGAFCLDAAAGADIVGAVTGHARLQTLSFDEEPVSAAGRAAVGAALGALVAADAPALTTLDLWSCRHLGDDGLRPLFNSLPRNTHLRELYCSRNDFSQAFARDVLLPAVRANTSLRKLVIDTAFDGAAEAKAIVSSRVAV